MVARSVREQFRRISGPAAAPLVVTDGALVTADAVWAWVQVPDASTFLLEDEQIGAATMTTAKALGSLLPAGAEFHLKSVRAPHTGAAYREGWAQVASVRAPKTDQYIELGAHRIEKSAYAGVFRRKITLLGVSFPDPTAQAGPSVWSRFGAAAPTSAKSRHRTAEERLAAARVGVDRWITAVGRSVLHAEPAAAGLIAWAYARELRRTALAVPDAAVVTRAGLAGLAHGRVDPTHSRTHLVVTDLETGGVRFVSILVSAAVTGFPAQGVEVPGEEWLDLFGDLPGVEVSVRGVNHGQVRSRQLLGRALKVARSQIRESDITDGPPPPEALEAEDILTERMSEVTHRVDVETTLHPRWVVHAKDPKTLADRVDRLRQRYDGIVDLQLVGDIQDLLFKELLPGDRVRVPEFGADQPMRTLAGSWFHGGSPFGDHLGPYMGANRGSSSGPVQIHIGSRTEADKKMPTTFVFTGRAGSGKSTALELCVLGLLAEGAWALLTDVKGDLAGIAAAARDVLGVPVQTVDATDPGCAGTMDPMRFAPTGDEARTLTIDALLGALSAGDRRRGEAAIEAAVDTVLTIPRGKWSTPKVIETLCDLPASDPNAEVGREVGRILAVRARSPQLRAVADHLAPGRAALSTGRGLIYLRLDGLDFPHHTPDPGQWSVPQRCSMATLRTALAYALHQSRRARTLKKVVALTELHLLTRYPEGRQFVEWLARVGRALQTYLLLDSQSAHDLAAIVGLTEQILMAFCFLATGHAEQDAQAALLGRPDPGPQLRAAMATLGTGECVARDRRGRLTVMEFDRLTTHLAQLLATDAGDDADHTDDADEANELCDICPIDVAGTDDEPDSQQLDDHLSNGESPDGALFSYDTTDVEAANGSVR